MSNRLEGKIAAITGAASGFGAAATLRFIEEGGKVILGDIQDDAGQALADSLGDAARFCHCDVTQENQVASLVDMAVSEFGRLDVMYNNAGIVGAAGPIHTTPAEEWKFTLDILLNGVFYGIKHAARVMIPQQSGSIVNMTSTAGIMGGLGPHAYAAAKHGVVGLTKTAAYEFGRQGVRVNAICPFFSPTPLVTQEGGLADRMDTLKKSSPMNRMGDPEEMVEVMLMLMSPTNSFMNGQAVAVDGGMSAI